MDTIIPKTTVTLDIASQLILAGKVIAYPTETVFGLGCLATSSQAIETLNTLKTRCKNKGYIILVANTAQARNLIHQSQHHLLAKAATTWPGPTTWVFRAAEHLSTDIIQEDRVAIRISPHPVAQKLCALVQRPIISTSANLAQQNPLCSADDIHATFGSKISAICEGLPDGNPPSTIIDAASKKVLRG